MIFRFSAVSSRASSDTCPPDSRSVDQKHTSQNLVAILTARELEHLELNRAFEAAQGELTLRWKEDRR